MYNIPGNKNIFFYCYHSVNITLWYIPCGIYIYIPNIYIDYTVIEEGAQDKEEQTKHNTKRMRQKMTHISYKPFYLFFFIFLSLSLFLNSKLLKNVSKYNTYNLMKKNCTMFDQCSKFSKGIIILIEWLLLLLKKIFPENIINNNYSPWWQQQKGVKRVDE